MPNRIFESKRADALANVTAPVIGPPVNPAFPPASVPGTGRFRTPIGPLIQRARLNPRALTRNDIAQLHRSLGNAAVGRLLTGAAKPNRTGLPDGLKANVEAMSGLPMDDVRVHYNSPKPAELQAHAYARGTEIHLGPGQERHLPHEAWHVVQQKQGRVRATSQMKDLALNTDTGLEGEADTMGAAASAGDVRGSGMDQSPPRNDSSGPAPVQRLFDEFWKGRYSEGASEDDVANPGASRKMGVEITESRDSQNRIYKVNPQPLFANQTSEQKKAFWTGTVHLPYRSGNVIEWYVSRRIDRFGVVGGKDAWMRWGDVRLTEDHGEYEWIIKHPDNPQNLRYYRDKLNSVDSARKELRAALPENTPIILSPVLDPQAGQAVRLYLGDDDRASAQITFESTDPNTTKRVLNEGTSFNLNSRNQPNRTLLQDQDVDLANSINASALQIHLPVPFAPVDLELIVAYIYGDLMHKMALVVSGSNFNNLAGNFKNWRTLFPKSKPYQITVQAFGRQPTALELTDLRTAIAAAEPNVRQNVLDLFIDKMNTSGSTKWAGHLWHPPIGYAGPPVDPAGHLMTFANMGGMPQLITGGDDRAGFTASLLSFFAGNHGGSVLTLAAEYANVRDALTDANLANPLVARSYDGGFADHPPGTAGFAAEDRGEIATSFPYLVAVYERIKALALRF